MRNLAKVLFFALCLFLSQSFIYASQGSFGSETFTDSNGTKHVYSKLCLQPQFSIWKIDIGLNLELYLDENGNGREEDWDSWEDAVNKILYVRYGKKGEPLFINFGGINSASIGHGIIFNRYSNMIRYPEVKKTGLLFDINMPSWGIETLTSNLSRAEVLGARFYFRPFYNSGVFLIDNLAIGVSAGTDLDPDSVSTSTNDTVSVVAADVELPLIKSSLLSTTLFADFGQMQLGDVYVSTHSYYNPVKNSTETVKSSNNGTGFVGGFFGKLFCF